MDCETRKVTVETIAMYTKIFKFQMALFFSFYSSLVLLNNIIVLITQSHLSTAQASSSLKWLNTHNNYIHVNHANLCN